MLEKDKIWTRVEEWGKRITHLASSSTLVEKCRTAKWMNVLHCAENQWRRIDELK